VIALFWDNLRAAMSSGFPASGSGDLLHIVLYTLLGLTGMIFTGMLISIFSTSMRGKLLALQTENPMILEKGHVVVLGFRQGEYSLLNQLMIAAGGKKRTVVVVEAMERTDMEQAIRTNIRVPKNIRLVAINANTESAAELECCAIESASRVVIYTRSAGRTVKTYLAVTAILKDAEKKPKLVTTVDADAADFPDDLLPAGEISLLHSGSVVARIIAHAATQPGIFEAFLEMIDFTGFEFYFEEQQELAGRPFWKAVLTTTNGITVGLYRAGKVMLNPAPDTEILQGDLLVVFEEKPGDAHLEDPESVSRPAKASLPPLQPIPEVVIFGINASIATVIRELPDNILRVRLAGLSPAEFSKYLSGEEGFVPELMPDYRGTETEEALADMVKDASHLIVLSDRQKGEEDADTGTVMQIMRLRNLKKKLGLRFTITAEMRCENNRKLIAESGGEDIVVASDLSSMMLAQVAEDPRRLGLFNDLLDDNGSEVYLKPLVDFRISGAQMTVRELRRHIYGYGYIPVGIRTKEGVFQVLDDNIPLQPRIGDCLVLIGEE
jgi:Trk K+ transport system NAD-binding subunit